MRTLTLALFAVFLAVPAAAGANAVMTARAQNARTGGGSHVVRTGNEYHHAGTGLTTLDVNVRAGTTRSTPKGTWFQEGRLMHMTPHGVSDAPWHLKFEASNPSRIPDKAPTPKRMARLAATVTAFEMRLGAGTASAAQRDEARIAKVTLLKFDPSYTNKTEF